MSMNKFSLEDKLIIVKEYLAGGMHMSNLDANKVNESFIDIKRDLIA